MESDPVQDPIQELPHFSGDVSLFQGGTEMDVENNTQFDMQLIEDFCQSGIYSQHNVNEEELLEAISSNKKAKNPVEILNTILQKRNQRTILSQKIQKAYLERKSQQ